MCAKCEKTDLRVRLTKIMLRQSFTELLKVKPLQSITVSEICEKAAVNRSTFYSHYNDIYDMLEKIEEDMYNELLSSLGQIVFTPDSSEKQVPVFMYGLFEFFKRNSDMCMILLGKNSDKRFLKKLLNVAKDRSINEYSAAYPKAKPYEIEIFYTFVASGCLGLLEMWFDNGMKESPSEMAANASRLISKSVSFLK